MHLPVSALDQSPIFEGKTPDQALQESIDLAKGVEALGFYRYWLAEHHGSQSFAGCAPEVFIAKLAAETQSIRVGSGGVMLSHYSPFKVAECFKTLTALFPDRIDLGFGRAPGGDPYTSGALAWGSQTTAVNYYPQKVADLMSWLHEQPPTTEAFKNVKITPGCGQPPEAYVLCSSQGSLDIALQQQLPIVLAHFISDDCIDLGPRYKQLWKRQPSDSEGKVILAVFALCADTEEKALQIAAPGAVWRQRISRGHFQPFMNTEAAVEKLKEKGQSSTSAGRMVGTIDSIKPQLSSLIEASQCDELMVVSICEQADDRLRSYELIQSLVQSL